MNAAGARSGACCLWVPQGLHSSPPSLPPQGASANWWNHRHFQHHAKPNIFSKDPDVNMLHVFVLGERQPVEVGLERTERSGECLACAGLRGGMGRGEQTDPSVSDVYMESFPGHPESFKLEFQWPGLLRK